jgi:hypothetical protein
LPDGSGHLRFQAYRAKSGKVVIEESLWLTFQQGKAIVENNPIGRRADSDRGGTFLGYGVDLHLTEVQLGMRGWPISFGNQWQDSGASLSPLRTDFFFAAPAQGSTSHLCGQGRLAELYTGIRRQL